MKQTRTDIMGMPIIIEINDVNATPGDFDAVFSYFQKVDARFSTYKKDSEIMKVNRQEINRENVSTEMKDIFTLAQETKEKTKGYFDIQNKDGFIDPSGIVKGWAIHKASKLLLQRGFKNFYIEAGGDIATYGQNSRGQKWVVGIRSPFNTDEIIKTVKISNLGIATSGNYIRGAHIYNPHSANSELKEVVSVTVIGPNILEADRFATAAFAMGRHGIYFIDSLDGFEGYAVDASGRATYTKNFNSYTI